MLVKQIPNCLSFEECFIFSVYFFFTLLQSCLNESEPLLSWQLDVLRRFGGGGVLFIHFHITFFVRWLLVQLNHQRSFFTLENRFEIFQYFHFRMKNEKKSLLFFFKFLEITALPLHCISYNKTAFLCSHIVGIHQPIFTKAAQNQIIITLTRIIGARDTFGSARVLLSCGRKRIEIGLATIQTTTRCSDNRWIVSKYKLFVVFYGQLSIYSSSSSDIHKSSVIQASKHKDRRSH